LINRSPCTRNGTAGSHVLLNYAFLVIVPQQDEEFYQISLDVRGKRTLAESLDSYVSKELMDGQNQYLCEELGKKVRLIF